MALRVSLNDTGGHLSDTETALIAQKVVATTSDA